MSDEPPDPGTRPAPALGTRWPEVAVAGGLVLLALVVITDSIRVGTGWGDDGPRSGASRFR